ncbi:hypothetical protein MYRNA_35 [Mycobacterium phage Myrna]|uniref:Uncharacterized protein n=1 Tax=Mycobacterium phage Myrna TaxID=546805 RepID=B5LJ46_9CAUD|nr:gp35 [Mycobacterium phage Myrna]ACH62043.1 hypothetical protein MYRNA_35 [Mycobacterium phage Myrna]
MGRARAHHPVHSLGQRLRPLPAREELLLMTMSITGVKFVKTGDEATKLLEAAMLGMSFTDNSGHHDVKVIAARIRDELMTMGWEMQMTGEPDIKGRLERAAGRLQERIDELRDRRTARTEVQRLEAKLDGVKLALSYFGDYR